MGSVAISRIDGISTSVAVKAPVHAVATANIVLSGLQTIGGIVLDGNLLYRVLLTGQTNSVENGIYDASTGSWTRSSDFDDSRDVVTGTIVIAPLSSPLFYYRVSSANPIVPGTSAITFLTQTGLDTLVADLANGVANLVGSTAIKYKQTAAELAASVTPVNLYKYYGDINRYGTNTTPGTTDMTTALQAALNTGYPVYVPSGTYLITSACQMKTTYQLIYGDGQLSILLTKTDIETLNSTTGVFGVVIRDINFNNTYTGGGGGPTHFHIHFGTDASGCTVLRCGLNTSLTGSVVSTSFHAGIWFEGGNLNNILDCTFVLAQILMGSTDSTIRGGYVYAFVFEYAIKVVSAGEVLIQGVRGILGGPSKGGVWVPSASYMNKILGCYFGGTYSTMNNGGGIFADQQQMMQIIGNTFHEMDGIGVHLTTPTSGNIISGNTFWAGHPKQNDATLLIEGNPDIYLESIAYGGSGTIVKDNICNRFNGPIEDGMPGIGKSYAIKVNTFAGTANNYIKGNSVSGARYFAPSITDDNVGDIVADNPGAQVWRSWTPSDISGAGLTFTAVNCKYMRDVETITAYGEFTFPTTASGAGVTIGGLPFAHSATQPLSGAVVITNAVAPQKIKLSAGNSYFVITDVSDTQQSNSACSGKYFKFCIRYPV